MIKTPRKVHHFKLTISSPMAIFKGNFTPLVLSKSFQNIFIIFSISCLYGGHKRPYLYERSFCSVIMFWIQRKIINTINQFPKKQDSVQIFCSGQSCPAVKVVHFWENSISGYHLPFDRLIIKSSCNSRGLAL